MNGTIQLDSNFLSILTETKIVSAKNRAFKNLEKASTLIPNKLGIASNAG